MPFTHYRTQGIFLKKEDRGEADQLFTIFTKDYGKLEILGKAIRKIKSKLRSGAELFYFSEIEFIQGKTYKILTDTILIDKFKNLRQNPQKLEIAYKITEALDSLTGQEESDKKLWQLLLETFQKLNAYNLLPDTCNLIYYYFLWNLFSFLGFKPELYNCSICGKKLLPETFWLLPKEGGIICWQCFGKLPDEEKKLAKEISVDTVKILRIFLLEDWQILLKLKITAEAKENLKEISKLYLSFLSEEFSKPEK
jgi:DNA repair protein RecO (recombination protein O)